MDPLHPLAGAPLTSGETQRQVTDAKRRQIRQSQLAARHIARYGDGFESPVENAQAIAPIHDETPERQPKKRERKPHEAPADDEDHIDVTA